MCLLPGRLLFYFCPLTTRQLVGILVGIGSKQRRKLFQIQIVTALGN
jgi:hypothetical protein